MSSSLDRFKQLLAEVAGFSKWALAGVTALPLVTLAVDLSPPWPKGAPVVTSLVELVVLMVTYHFVRSSPRRIVDRALVIGATLLVLASLIYFALLSALVYPSPNGDRFVRGYQCTRDAEMLYTDTCPLLPQHQIAEANYAADRLWTPTSIIGARLTLLVAWSVVFASLAAVFASFITYHLRQERPPRQAGGKI